MNHDMSTGVFFFFWKTDPGTSRYYLHIFLFPLGYMAQSHFLYTNSNIKEREKRSRNSFVKTNVRGNQI